MIQRRKTKGDGPPRLAADGRVYGTGPTTADVYYEDDEREFIVAMERYRRRRPFPTCAETLAVLKSLGYRKVAEPTDIPRPGTPRSASDGTD